MKPSAPLLLVGALALCAAGAALAQSVALSGMLGAKALLVIDGSAPKSVGVGESYRGVTVVSTQSDQAVVDIAGTRQTLRMGEDGQSVVYVQSGELGGQCIIQQT